MKLSDLVNKSAELEVPFEDESLRVRFAPHRYDYKAQVLIAALGKDFDFSKVIDLLERLLLDWDFTDDKGKKVPVSREVLETLPIPLLMGIVNAIMQDISGSKNAPNSQDS